MHSSHQPFDPNAYHITIPQQCRQAIESGTPLKIDPSCRDTLPFINNLEFIADLSDVPERFKKIFIEIAKLSVDTLWSWKLGVDGLLVNPPSSQLLARCPIDGNILSNVFIAPNPNELKQLATDVDGSLKRLNNLQKAEIQKYGRFSVDSVNFKGTSHVWRLTQLIQKGTEATLDSFYNNLALSYEILFLWVKNRLFASQYSLFESYEHVGYSLYFIYNLFIGAVGFRTANIQEKIDDCRLDHLLKEIKPENRKQLRQFVSSLDAAIVNKYKFSFVTKKISWKAVLNYIENDSIKVTNPPNNIYTNSDNTILNLDAICPNLTNSIQSSALQNIFNISNELTKAEVSVLKIKEMIEQYRKDGFDENKISTLLETEYNNCYFNNLINYFQRHSNQLLPNKSYNIVDVKAISVYLRGLAVLEDSIIEWRELIKNSVEQRTNKIKQTHLIKSKSNKWYTMTSSQIRETVLNEYPFISILKKNIESKLSDSNEWKYFIDRNESFQEQLSEIRANIAKQSLMPSRTLTCRRFIWNPMNQVYLIEGDNIRHKEVVIIDTPLKYKLVDNNPKYRRVVSVNYYTSTAQPGWRIKNFFISSYTWLSNVLYFLLVAMILWGPYSLSALFQNYPFPSGFALNQETGNLHVQSRTDTLIHKIRKLWISIHTRRRQFEALPDTGFLGKQITRIFNVFYLYFVIGVLGTIILMTLFPLACLLCISMGILLLLVIWGWYPLGVIIALISRWFIYDWDYFDTTENARNSGGASFPLFYLLIYKLTLKIVLQILLCLVSLIVLPLFSFIIALFGLIRWSIRSAWDKLIYHLVLKLLGRIPVTDSFVAKRISGPGLATYYYYQIVPSQALIKLEYSLEQIELNMYENYMAKVINLPADTLNNFMRNIIHPLSCNVSLTEKHAIIHHILAQQRVLQDKLQKAMTKRRQQITLDAHTVDISKIRMTLTNLSTLLPLCTKFTRNFYVNRLFQYHYGNTAVLFEKHGLPENDWEGLAKYHLSNAFSQNILIPLENEDQSFHLQVDNMGFEHYLKNIENSLSDHDLSSAKPIFDQHKYVTGVLIQSRYNLKWLKKFEYAISNNDEPSTYYLSSFLCNKSKVTCFIADKIGWGNILESEHGGKD